VETIYVLHSWGCFGFACFVDFGYRHDHKGQALALARHLLTFNSSCLFSAFQLFVHNFTGRGDLDWRLVHGDTYIGQIGWTGMDVMMKICGVFFSLLFSDYFLYSIGSLYIQRTLEYATNYIPSYLLLFVPESNSPSAHFTPSEVKSYVVGTSFDFDSLLFFTPEILLSVALCIHKILAMKTYFQHTILLLFKRRCVGSNPPRGPLHCSRKLPS